MISDQPGAQAGPVLHQRQDQAHVQPALKKPRNGISFAKSYKLLFPDLNSLENYSPGVYTEVHPVLPVVGVAGATEGGTGGNLGDEDRIPGKRQPAQ